MCSFLQYASSISSYMVLSLVSHLSFTITNTMKRLVIIFSGIWYFQQDLSWLNILGVVLAVAGVFCYNMSKDLLKPPPTKTVSGEEMRAPTIRAPQVESDSESRSLLDEGGPLPGDTPYAAVNGEKVYGLGLRQDRDLDDLERALDDPTYTADIPRTESYN